MRRLWTWSPGRQMGCEYRKLLLWEIGSARLTKWFDAYIIEYPPNAHLPAHTDKVEKGRHYRINLELRGKGEFKVAKPIFKLGPVVMFRPDLMEHEMQNGPSKRCILSLGFVV